MNERYPVYKPDQNLFLDNCTLTLISNSYVERLAPGQNETGRSLTDEGIELAKATGKYLVEEVVGSTPDLVITSGVRYADQTASRLVRRKPVTLIRNPALSTAENPEDQERLDKVLAEHGHASLATIAASDIEILEIVGNHAVHAIIGTIMEHRPKNVWEVGPARLQNLIALKLLPYFLSGRQRETVMGLLLMSPPMKECGWISLAKDTVSLNI